MIKVNHESRAFQLLLFSAIAVCICLSGCVGTIKKVDIIRIGEVRVHDIDQDSLRCLVSADVRNPHPMKVRMRDLSFSMGITRGPIGAGHVQKEMEIDSDSVKNVQIPLTVQFKNLTQSDFDALFGSYIPYHITGTFELKKPIHKKEVEVDSTGRIKAPRRMKFRLTDDSFMNLISFEPSALDQIKLLSGHGTVKLKIQNPFKFDIGFYSFKYHFESGGKVVADGFLVKPQLIHPGANELELPVDVHFKEGIKEAIGSMLDTHFHLLNMTGTLVLRSGRRKLYADLTYQRAPGKTTKAQRHEEEKLSTEARNIRNRNQ